MGKMRTWKKMMLSLALAAGVAVGGTAEAMTLDEEQQLDVLSAQNQIWEKNMSIEEAVAIITNAGSKKTRGRKKKTE